MSTAVRVSGKTGGEEAAHDAAQELDQQSELEMPEERSTLFKTQGFSRMRFVWRNEDARVMNQIHDAVDKLIYKNFREAFLIQLDLYEIVREAEVDEETGEVIRDRFNMPKWKKSPTGAYIENYSALTSTMRDNFIFRILNVLFDMEQKKEKAWMESMFAKAVFEERFAEAYDEPKSGTIEARTAKANIAAAEDRYFALFQTAYSRRADSLVRSFTLLNQRLKDSLNT
jgi:hypothetical protein